MAIVKSNLGKIKGKVGNLVLYEGRNGKNICRANGIPTSQKTEEQKRHFEAFGAVARISRGMMQAIRVGFPGEKHFPAGRQGFIRANVNTAVTVDKITPEKEVSAQKRAPQEFCGRVDFTRLRVADGSLEAPEGVTAEVDTGTQRVRFVRQGMKLESPYRFRDDLIYGVVTSTVSPSVCRIFPLGARGEADDRTVMVESEHIRVENAAVYVFATSADGKQASPSVYLTIEEE